MGTARQEHLLPEWLRIALWNHLWVIPIPVSALLLILGKLLSPGEIGAALIWLGLFAAATCFFVIVFLMIRNVIRGAGATYGPELKPLHLALALGWSVIVAVLMFQGAFLAETITSEAEHAPDILSRHAAADTQYVLRLGYQAHEGTLYDWEDPTLEELLDAVNEEYDGVVEVDVEVRSEHSALIYVFDDEGEWVYYVEDIEDGSGEWKPSEQYLP